MKIAIAQTNPIRWSITSNVAQHLKHIRIAQSHRVGMLIFPELSLTGYEPTHASRLAIDSDDLSLSEFQVIADESNMVIGLGVPLKSEKGLSISMVLFQPDKERLIYSKKHLHADEEPFFISGSNFPTLNVNGYKIGLAICYELSVPEHAQKAVESGAEIFIASVAKTLRGVNKAAETLSGIAKEYSIPVLMSNCIGVNDGEECAGRSAAWNEKGELLEQLDLSNEGLLIFDMKTFKTEKVDF